MQHGLGLRLRFSFHMTAVDSYGCELVVRDRTTAVVPSEPTEIAPVMSHVVISGLKFDITGWLQPGFMPVETAFGNYKPTKH